MNRTSIGNIDVFAKVPFNYHFQTVVDDFGLYRHEYRRPDDLLPALKTGADEGGIDLVILGTCEIDLREAWTKDLLSIWDDRPEGHKFQLVCIVHNVKDVAWQPAITEWSRRGAIRLITISEHVATSFRESFDALADSRDPILRSAGYENIPVDVHVPVLALPNLPERPRGRPLTKAVIQGSFDTVRRDYINIFKDLNASLHEDPSAWGYQALGDELSFVEDTSLDAPPFQLFALGSGHLEVPVELKNVVQIKTGLTYPEFYDLMSQMDVCVPAFAENGYYHLQASSTFVMAVQCNVPIIVTKRTRKSYVYADDDRPVITRPAAMREVLALKALRTGDASFFLESPMPNMQGTMKTDRFLVDAVEEMMRRSWTRTTDELEAFKIGLWRRNDRLADRLLFDL
ncbi:hypothetical protein FPV67DRAFT_1560545 [Lyophyllum atratum]|nr:hypothetical protein FPV67DRAFT_1560545 [Lyophyllum atratum]